MSIIEKAVGKRRDKPEQNDSIQEEKQLIPPDRNFDEVSFEDTSKVNRDLDSSQRGEKEIIELPISRLKKLGMVTLDMPRSHIAEEYRVIKRPLLENFSGRGAVSVQHSNLIMVTSAVQGEGKTFTALNLAMSMAMERDRTILFVDADFTKASATSLLGISNDRPGLIDVLEHEEISVADVLLETNVPGLKVIPAGQLHERSTELLASDDMRHLMVELSERYDDRIIVFDAPPLLLTTEASVLANLMGQIVFVVAAERTSKETINEALESLNQEKIIGMVLNKTKKYIWDKLRYGYGHSYGYRQDNESHVASS